MSHPLQVADECSGSQAVTYLDGGCCSGVVQERLFPPLNGHTESLRVSCELVHEEIVVGWAVGRKIHLISVRVAAPQYRMPDALAKTLELHHKEGKRGGEG